MSLVSHDLEPYRPLIEAIKEVMTYLDDGLANGACAFCDGESEEAGHAEGCLCDMLKKSLDAEVEAVYRKFLKQRRQRKMRR